MLTLDDVRKAEQALKGVIHRTPLIPSRSLSQMVGSRILFKAENLQRTGSFKIRGAFYKMTNLTPQERARGVITASAGNHAQGVALAAREIGISATVVMPEDASIAKEEATRNYGAEVILKGRDYDEARQYAQQISRERELSLISAFDDEAVMAGQGTVGLEILQEAPDVEVILVPVGGGGLISGIALAVKALRPTVKVVGVQAAGAASCVSSLRVGRRQTLETVSTVADGIAVKTPGRLTFPLIQRYVDEVVAVEDSDIAQAMVLLLERAKLVVEGAGAIGLAALLAGKIQAQDKTVAVVLSGGNIDVNLLDRVIQHGLTAVGRYLILRTRLPDRPGQLFRLLRFLAQERVNILDVVHHRAGLRLPLGEAEIHLTLETRDAAHRTQVITALQTAGYMVEDE